MIPIMKWETYKEEIYGNFFDVIKEKGYEFVKPLPSTTHAIGLFNKDGLENVVLKFNYEGTYDISRESSTYEKLKGIPGIEITMNLREPENIAAKTKCSCETSYLAYCCSWPKLYYFFKKRIAVCYSQ